MRRTASKVTEVLKRTKCFVTMRSVKQALLKYSRSLFHKGVWLNIHLHCNHYFGWHPTQDMISMTLMKGRVLLVGDVGVSVLLHKKKKKACLHGHLNLLGRPNLTENKKQLTCKQPLVCSQWASEAPGLPGSTPCGHAFVCSADRKGLQSVHCVKKGAIKERQHTFLTCRTISQL